MYSIGPASCAVPGLPAALDELWARTGDCRGLASSSPHSFWRGQACRSRRCTLAPSRCSGSCTRSSEVPSCSFATRHARGRRDARPAGARRRARGDRRRGRRQRVHGHDRGALLPWTGSSSRADDLEEYARLWREPAVVSWNGRRVATRGGLSGVPELLPRLPRLADSARRSAYSPSSTALETADVGGEHTTNMVAVDGAWPSVRPHPQLGRRRRRLAPRLRHAAQQSPRRERHRVRRARCRETIWRAAWRPRSSSTTTGSSSRSARRARRAFGQRSRRPRRRPRRGARPRERRSAATRPPHADSGRRRARRRRGRARGARVARAQRAALGAPPPLLRRRELRRAGRRRGRSAAERRRASSLTGQQQLVDAARSDEHPDDAHRRRGTRRSRAGTALTVPVVSDRTSSIPWYSGRHARSTGGPPGRR